MPEAIHDSSADLFLTDLQLAGGSNESHLTLGQTVVVCEGVLQGATGAVVKRVARGHYLIALESQKGPIWARLPAHLLREA